ncbi:hypothetical protein FQN53_007083 [Emmonsiellopsis sp. PD_33]|nr:hypothetical protein FQN53_007083 [Emmonsiellopsis sp. PD_33]
MEESNELSLSELCTICHINPPKYKCPRCLTSTCSLPCVKRHKIWSQCSGVRDPAAYLKRKELSTPSAFDKDFNFISGIERFVERAERGAERRGVELRRDEVQDAGEEGGEGGRRKKRVRKEPVKGEVALMRGLEQARVMVIRAPRGMSRAKMNLTGWNKKWKCLSWTVEWVVVEGAERRRGISKCLETTGVRDAFERSSFAKGMGGRDDRDKEKGKGKEKEKGECAGDMLPPPPPQPQPSIITIRNEFMPADSQDERARSPTALSHTLSPEPEPKSVSASTSTPAPQPNPESTPEPEQKHTHTFYLHRPHTPSRLPVLIPIPHPSTTTITDALRERVVLEFPTFYVLPWTPDALPKNRFVLEEVYLRENAGKEDGEVEGEGGSEVDAEGESEADEDVLLDSVDQGKVLEVLYKDLEAGGGGVNG